YTAKYPNL
nr:Chain C, NP205-LCMV epitope, YTAKYPNL [synthetic construct]3P4O_F Chain F, NP205-LCMV epitope, YTAKYPNL [synthetic construct]